MDINENDKKIGTDVPEETSADAATEVVAEETTAEETTSEENTSTIEVSQEDIDEELMRYGALTEDVEETAESEETSEEETLKKKCPVQKPIIISAVAILLTAVVVMATIFIYNGFFKPGISGVWELEEAVGSGTYFVFDKKGNISMDGGGIEYFGTYTMGKNEAGEKVINTDFYILAYYGGEAVVTYSADRQTMTFTFESGSINFVKSELPEFEIDPSVITHASADELSIDEVNIDDAIIGSWSEEMYGTYTFNEDGTGSYLSEYSYSDYYGYGFGMRYNFKYTVYEDEILITLDYYTGDSEDGYFTYGVDGDNLVLNGMGYAKVSD
ncbi:MAG: hypothetical protein IJC86_03500 [Clostridia bacterium]|nr:hypothetical protein [Clostridia bacterium]